MSIKHFSISVPPVLVVQASLAFFGVLAVTSSRADLVYGIEVGAGYSDNILRADADEESETIGTAGFDLAWQERTHRLDADVAVDLSYFEYLDDTYEGEIVGTADGTVILGIVPERFTWAFQDSFGQAQSDPFAPATPDTRENLNYFTTGPDLILRFGPASSLRLFGRYSATEYEESPLDAERTSGGLAIARHPSDRSEIALNAVTERIDFEDEINQDFDRHHAFLSYNMEGSRTELTTELGYTWLERDDEETGGALVNVSVSRDLSPSSTVVLELGTQLTDAAESLRSSAGHPGGGADITATSDPFENRSIGLAWHFSRNRTGMVLGASWHEDRYEEVTLFDRTRVVYDASFTRQLTRTLEFGLLGMLIDEEFDNTGMSTDELTLGAVLRWNLGRTVDVSLTVDRIERDTSDALGEFTENRAFLTLGYRPRGRAAPSPP